MKTFYPHALHSLRFFPVETSIIFFVGLFAACSIHLIDALTDRWGIGIDPRQILMGPMAGGELFHYSSLAIFAYGGLLLLRYFFVKDDKQGASGLRRAMNDSRFFVVALSALYWFLVSGAFVFGSAALFNALFKSFSYQEMSAASDLLMHWDTLLFGVHPPFFLHTLSVPQWIQNFSADCYAYLPSALALLLAVTFCLKQKLFRICLLSLALSFYISLPLWIAFPAIPPYEMYVLNTLERDDVAPGIASEASAIILSERTVHTVNAVESMWIDAIDKRSFSVSEFPSSHVIWASILLYAAYRIRRWLGLLVLPLYAGNFFATMYLMQHYAVDTLLGVAVAALAIYIAQLLLKHEEAYFTDRFGLLSIFSALDPRTHITAAHTQEVQKIS